MGPAPSGTLLPPNGSSMVPTCSNIQLERNGTCCQQGAIGCKMAQETYRSSVCDPNFSCGYSGAAKMPNDLPVLKPSWRQTTKASTSSKLSSPHAMKHESSQCLDMSGCQWPVCFNMLQHASTCFNLEIPANSTPLMIVVDLQTSGCDTP